MGTIRTLIDGATIIPVEPGMPDAVVGWLAIGDDGRIASLGTGAPPAAERVVDATGMLVAPGFVSAHSHLFTSASRGLGASEPLYGWIQAMTRYTEHATPQQMGLVTLHGAIDHLASGVTTVYDFAASRSVFRAASAGHGRYVGELRPFELYEAQYEAKVRSGIRFVHSIGLDDAEGDDADVLARFERMHALHLAHRHVPTAMGVAISGAAQWSDDERTARLEAEAMDAFGVLNQAHLLETPYALDAQRERFWWYDKAGALTPRMIFGHFIHADAPIRERVAESGAAVSWQPASNGRLGSGILDVPDLLARGIPVGIGLDDQACTDLSDPFENLRVGMFVLRASRQDASLLSPRQALELATLGSARVLRLDGEVGSLAPGKYADLVLLDSRHPDLGPVWDPVATYVLSASPRNIRQVWVGGEVVVDAAAGVRTVDAEALSEEVHRVMGAIKERVDAGG